MLLATVLTSLLIFSSQAYGRAPSRAKLNYMHRLKSSCEDGLGQSCYDYAMYLRDVAHDKDSKKIQRYVHRACLLTYQPACGKSDKPEKARAGDPKHACSPDALLAATFSPMIMPDGKTGMQITRLQPGSPFQRAGLNIGDVVTRMNGTPMTSAAQIATALGDGNAMAEVQRGPVTSVLLVSCR